MKRVLLILLFFAPALAHAQDPVDVRGGFFEERTESLEENEPVKEERITPRRKSMKEIRSERVDRNPRGGFLRKKVDRALDITLHEETAKPIQHGLDAADIIRQGVGIRNKRVEENTPKN